MNASHSRRNRGAILPLIRATTREIELDMGRKNNRFKAGFAAILVSAYTLVGGYGASFNFPEIFPFFNWALFSFPAKIYNEWVVEVIAIDGDRLSEPADVHLIDRFDHFGSGEGKVLREWGKSVEQRDLEAAKAHRSLFENLYRRSDAEQVRYRLVLRRSNPVQRWEHGTVLSETVEGEFTWVKDSGEQP